MKRHVPRPKRDPQYWQALGFYVESFALAEKGLFTYLAARTGLPYHYAVAVLSGANVKTSIDLVRRIWRVDKTETFVEDRTKTDRVFVQLREIENMRNQLLHHGTNYIEGSGRITSNIAKALGDMVQEARVSPKVLKDMSSDLQVIARYFLVLTLRHMFQHVSGAQYTDSKLRAWHYKSSQGPRPRPRRPIIPARSRKSKTLGQPQSSS